MRAFSNSGQFTHTSDDPMARIPANSLHSNANELSLHHTNSTFVGLGMLQWWQSWRRKRSPFWLLLFLLHKQTIYIIQNQCPYSFRTGVIESIWQKIVLSHIWKQISDILLIQKLRIRNTILMKQKMEELWLEKNKNWHSIFQCFK